MILPRPLVLSQSHAKKRYVLTDFYIKIKVMNQAEVLTVEENGKLTLPETNR
ncbi:MAG: hypothetical protein LC778_02465 [Acidobacteria bacterium]|nr:hypothetical protein [Acidobacteriota bacterium]